MKPEKEILPCGHERIKAIPGDGDNSYAWCSDCGAIRINSDRWNLPAIPKRKERLIKWNRVGNMANVEMNKKVINRIDEALLFFVKK